MDHYEALGIDRKAAPEEIKAAHRRQAKATHPDINGGDGTAFRAVQNAYATLGNPHTRRRYDETGCDAEQKVQGKEMLARIFGEALERCEAGEDMIGKMREVLGNMVVVSYSENTKARISIELLKTRRQRLRLTVKSHYLLNIITERIHDFQSSIAHNEAMIKDCEAALALLEGSQYFAPRVDSALSALMASGAVFQWAHAPFYPDEHA